MDKRTYFFKAFAAGRYVSRAWMLRCFGVQTKDKAPVMAWDIGLRDGKYYTVDDAGTEIFITDPPAPGDPLYARTDKLVIEAGELPNVTATTRTAYVTAIYNIILLIWPYRKPLPYMADRFSPKDLDKIIEKALRGGEITLTEYYDRHQQALGRITAFTQILVYCATPKSIKADPEVLALRDKLYKELVRDGATGDPARLADADQQISQKDKENMKGDPAENFLLKGKQYATVRKKLYYFQGGVQSLDDPSRMDLLPTSLEEGLRVEDFPAAVNNLRSGSYSRAKDTALGGEASKFASRIFQNTKISEEDCGVTYGRLYRIRPHSVGKLVGRYLPGDDTPLDEERLGSLVGQSVYLRDPGTCKTGDGNYCQRCFGRRVSDSGVSIAALVNRQNNVYLDVALAVFHGSSLKTFKPRLADYVS